jgi:hypothetical protein
MRKPWSARFPKPASILVLSLWLPSCGPGQAPPPIQDPAPQPGLLASAW